MGERYVLRGSQSRVGCRTTGYYGLLQTLVDRGKLFLKSEGLGFLLTGVVFFVCALLAISFSGFFLFLLIFLGLMGLSLLSVTLSSANSFALVSFIRVVLISISFDVVMCFFILAGLFGLTLLFLGEYCGFFWITSMFNFLFVLGSFYSFLVFGGLIIVRAVLPRLKFAQVLKLS